MTITTVYQFSEYEDDRLEIQEPVFVSLEDLSRSVHLFDVVSEQNSEIVLTLAGAPHSFKSEKVHSRSATPDSRERSRVILPFTFIDTITNFSDVRLRVEWLSGPGGSATGAFLDVHLAIAVSFGADIYEGGDFVPTEPIAKMSLLDRKAWKEVGQFRPVWHHRLQQFFGGSEAAYLKILLEPLSHSDALGLDVVSSNHEPLPELILLADLEHYFEDGLMRVRARLNESVPPDLKAAGMCQARLTLLGLTDEEEILLDECDLSIPLDFSDVVDVCTLWFESETGGRTEQLEVSLGERSTKHFHPVIKASQPAGSSAIICSICWISTVGGEQLTARLSDGYLFVLPDGDFVDEIEIGGGTGEADIAVEPNLANAQLEVTVAAGISSAALARITPELDLSVPLARDPVVAIDIGTSSLCVATGLGPDGIEFVKLAKYLRLRDKDHLEAETLVGKQVPDALVSSTIGVFPAGDSELNHWRKSILPTSVWWNEGSPRVGSAGYDLSSTAADEDLPEVSVPFVMARNLLWGSGDGSLVAQNLKMQALSQRAEAKLTTLGARTTSGPTASVSVTSLYRAIFRELAAAHLPWSENFAAMRNGTLVLSHPNLITPKAFAWMKEAAEPLRIALGVDRKNVLLVTEGRAALQYAAAEYGRRIEDLCKDRPGQPARLLVFDLGAGTLDVTMGQVNFEGPKEDMVQETASVGASVGGNTMDLVLYFLLHDRLVDLEQRGVISYETRLVVDKSETADTGKSALGTRRAVRLAIDRAKRALYQIPDGEWEEHTDRSFEFEIEVRTDHRALLQINNEGLGEIYLKEAPPGPNERRRMMLCIPIPLSQIADYPAMQNLMSFMVRDVPLILKRQVKSKPDFVALTGRASLWPPFRAALSTAFKDQESPLYNAEWLDENSTVDHLKSAVVEGAVNYARNYSEGTGTKRRSQLPEFGIFRTTRAGREFRPEESGPRPSFVGNNEAVVSHPAGLEAFSIDSPDWRMSLLLKTETDKISSRKPAVTPDGRVRTRTNRLDRLMAVPLEKPTREIDPSGQALTYDDAPPGYQRK